MTKGQIKILLIGLIVAATLTACCDQVELPPSQPDIPVEETITLQVSPEVGSQEPTEVIQTQTVGLPALSSCAIGLGLRRETVGVILAFKENPGFVMSANMQLAEENFPLLSGWIRTLGAPSLAELENKAARAVTINLEYEALSYGLETSVTTPAEEWGNLVGATQ